MNGITKMTLCASDGALIRAVNDCSNFWLDKIFNNSAWYDFYAVGSDRGDLDWIVSTTAASATVTRVSGPAFTSAMENLYVGAIDPNGIAVFGCFHPTTGPAQIHFIDANTIQLVGDVAASTQSAARMHCAAGTAMTQGGTGGANFWDAGHLETQQHVRYGFVLHDNADKVDLQNSGITNFKAWGNYQDAGIVLGGSGGFRFGKFKILGSNRGYVTANRVPRNPLGNNTGNFTFGSAECENIFYRAFELGVGNLGEHHNFYFGHIHVLLTTTLPDAAFHLDNNVVIGQVGEFHANWINGSGSTPQPAVIQTNTPQDVQFAFDSIVPTTANKYEELLRVLNPAMTGLTLGPNINSQSTLANFFMYGSLASQLTDYPDQLTTPGNIWRYMPKYSVKGLGTTLSRNAWVLGCAKNMACPSNVTP